jgi:hypothetical protein
MPVPPSGSPFGHCESFELKHVLVATSQHAVPPPEGHEFAQSLSELQELTQVFWVGSFDVSPASRDFDGDGSADPSPFPSLGTAEPPQAAMAMARAAKATVTTLVVFICALRYCASRCA